uniref:Uncharacterized protein n=1 Tax=Utricularia reniformis TaxID=192314 RepID=A0A1Y0AZ68_9LAMI|nr:hypothetical protein AEK19_MT2073 [Utricularia reniformis]ART30429.1 hypothetical protein AEK19_MT2073 [Utricularia reniformis]
MRFVPRCAIGLEPNKLTLGREITQASSPPPNGSVQSRFNQCAISPVPLALLIHLVVYLFLQYIILLSYLSYCLSANLLILVIT